MSDDIKIVRTIKGLREEVEAWKKAGLRVALVPTMGALHIGHMSLIDEARKQADRVVVSIFVNPTQFAPHEDFDAYPRQEADDAAMVANRGGHLIYAPARDEMYPENFSTSIQVDGISKGLCGDSRPHFFGGVAIVVAKLLLQALAHVAIFGEKDYQQLLVIKRMARDLNIPTEIVGAPLVRDDDGLATSSRNKYLSADDRAQALALNRALKAISGAIKDGADAPAALEQGRAILAQAGIDKVDYLEIRDAETLEPITGPVSRPARAFVAAHVGPARLIDNMAVS